MIKDMDRASTQDLQIVFSDSRDLSSDAIALIVKLNKSDSDANAVMNISADVETLGESGIAKIQITKDHSDLTPTTYHYDIYYYPNDSANEQYLLEKGKFSIRERVSDKKT